MANRERTLQPVSFLQRHRFALFFFSFLVLYHVAVVNQCKPWKMDDFGYAFHCVDFSLGFATKILPGAVFQALFGSHASLKTATIYETVLIVLFFVGLSVLLEKLLLRVPEKDRSIAFFLLLFYVSGACTFSGFTKHLGALDVYWLFLSLFFFFFTENKLLRFLIPVLTFTAVFIHYSAGLNSVILFAVVLLYRCSLSQNRSEKRIWFLIFAVSVLIAGGAILFFVLNESRFLRSIEEFHEMLLRRGCKYFTYYDYAFYNRFDNESIVPLSVQNESGMILRIIYTVFYRIAFNFNFIKDAGADAILIFISALLLLAPILFVIFRFHVFRFRQETDKLKRFCTFLMIVQFPFTLISGILFSADINRWMTHAFLILFTCLLAVLYHEEEARNIFFRQVHGFLSSMLGKLYYLAYAAIIFPFYLQMS